MLTAEDVDAGWCHVYNKYQYKAFLQEARIQQLGVMAMGLSRHAQSLQYALNVLRAPKYKPYIRSVYLYGSCARLQQTFHSDVDLFLFLDNEIPDDLIREMRLEVIPHYSLPEVEIKYSKNEDFSNSYHFNQNLERDAKLIWERPK